MQSLLALFLLFLVRGSLCNEDSCNEKAKTECDSKLIPKNFPGNEVIVKAHCLNLKKFGECYLRVKEICSEDQNELDFMKKIINYIEDSCTEDSAAFQVILNNIGCVIPVARTTRKACTWNEISHQGRILIILQGKALVEKSKHLNQDNAECLVSYLRMACAATNIGLQCGSATRDAVFEILDNADYFPGFCSKEARKDLSHFDDVLEHMLVEENKLKNEIEEK